MVARIIGRTGVGVGITVGVGADVGGRVGVRIAGTAVQPVSKISKANSRIQILNRVLFGYIYSLLSE
jgi:hypothetical protein